MAVMWTHSHLTMRSRGRTEVAGEYTTVLELADSMHTQLHQYGVFDKTNPQEGTKSILWLTESTLCRRVTDDLHGGSITYRMPLLPTDANGRRGGCNGLRDLLKRDGWWTALVVISLLASLSLLSTFSTSFLGLVIIWVLVTFPATMLLTVCLGLPGRAGALYCFGLCCFLYTGRHFRMYILLGQFWSLLICIIPVITYVIWA